MERVLQIYEQDARYISEFNGFDWDMLRGKNILITGGTGLIGASLVRGIMERNQRFESRIGLFLLVRNLQKAEKLFEKYNDDTSLHYILGDINDKIEIAENIDYVIHGAGETSSKAFVTNPVETINMAINGTINVIRLAEEKKISGMVYLSSMEVYGKPFDEEPLTEDRVGYLDPLSVRSSYSESKRMAENICCSYVSEYGIPIKICRLTQTFGPGVLYGDGRVFADFARCVMEQRDIVLQTKGESRRMYLYTAEAATAILTVLLNGENGKAYNAANPETYCSIKEMADMVADRFGQGKCKVVFKIPDVPNASFNPTQNNYLDISAIQGLGWHAVMGLSEMYDKMICTMKADV